MTDSPVEGSARTDVEVAPEAVAELEHTIAAEVEPTLAVDADRRTHPLDLPRLIGGVLADIRTIAEGMAVLPKLLVSLNSIDSRVADLNDEVHEMRMRVDKMEGNVDDVTHALHPLRRIGDRRRGRPSEPLDPES